MNIRLRYPNEHYLPNFREALERDTQGLPLYQGGPGVDYSNAPVAYAVNISLILPVGRTHTHGDTFTPRPEDKVALFRRAPKTHGKAGSWSGISGYVDVVTYDPSPNYRPVDEIFDPIKHTVANELREEIRLPEEAELDFRVGEIANEKRTHIKNSRIIVVPVGAIITKETLAYLEASDIEPPCFDINKKEVDGQIWSPLCEVVAHHGMLAKNYLDTTLPGALGSTGLSYQQSMRLLISGEIPHMML